MCGVDPVIGSIAQVPVKPVSAWRIFQKTLEDTRLMGSRCRSCRYGTRLTVAKTESVFFFLFFNYNKPEVVPVLDIRRRRHRIWRSPKTHRWSLSPNLFVLQSYKLLVQYHLEVVFIQWFHDLAFGCEPDSGMEGRRAAEMRLKPRVWRISRCHVCFFWNRWRRYLDQVAVP